MSLTAYIKKLGMAVHAHNPSVGCRAEAAESLGLSSLVSSRFSETAVSKLKGGVAEERQLTSTSGLCMHTCARVRAHTHTHHTQVLKNSKQDSGRREERILAALAFGSVCKRAAWSSPWCCSCSLRNCAGYFPHCWGKIPLNKLREGFTSAPRFKGTVSPGGRTRRQSWWQDQAAAVHFAATVKKQRPSNAGAQLLPLYFSPGSQPV